MKKKIAIILAFVVLLSSVSAFATQDVSAEENGSNEENVMSVVEVELILNNMLPDDADYHFEFIGAKSNEEATASKRTANTEPQGELYGFMIVKNAGFTDGCYVHVDGVRVRSKPSTTATILGLLYEGDIVWYDSSESQYYANGYYWLHVLTDKNSNMGAQKGYVVTDYLDLY
jgi:hypothetical protein